MVAHGNEEIEASVVGSLLAPDELEHGWDRFIAGEHVHHLHAICYQVVFLYDFNQDVLQVADHFMAVKSGDLMLVHHPLQNFFKKLFFKGEDLGTWVRMLITVDIQVELNGISNWLMLAVV